MQSAILAYWHEPRICLLFRYLELGEKCDEALQIAFILIDTESYPQHIATYVGDAVAGLQFGIPALRIGASESEEAGMGSSVQRIEQFGSAEWRPVEGLKEVSLEHLHMLRNSGGRQAVIGKHPPHRVEAVERRGIEGRAHETARILRIADASRRKAEVLELGKPAGDRGPGAEARRRMEEGAAFARHRIFVAAAEEKGRPRRVSAERALEGHES